MRPLEQLWYRLTPESLLFLLSRVSPGWRWVKGARAEGACPEGLGKCMDRPDAAYCYFKAGEPFPPWIRCGNKNSCGLAESLYFLLRERVGSHPDVVRLVANAVGAPSHECDFYPVPRIKTRR